MEISEETLDDLLQGVLTKLLKSTTRIEATRGKTSELLGVLLELRNPRARLSHTEKKGKVFSGLGEWLWYLKKTNSLKFIKYYLSRYKKESEDNRTIYGAYGPRIFGHRDQDQYQNVINLLQDQPTSRRAVIQLFDAQDIATRRKEIPCTCSLQFLVRDQQIHLLVHSRSNDAFFGLPHDVFAFTMLQEMVAVALGHHLGTYRHFVGSLHLYDDKREAAEQYVEEGWQPTVGVAMPIMPAGDPWPAINKVLRAESTIRNGKETKVESLKLDPYWMDLVRLLEIFRLSKDRNTGRIASIKRKMASPVYDHYINRRQQPKSVESGRQLRMEFGQPTSDGGKLPRWLTKLTRDLLSPLCAEDVRETAIIPWSSPVPVFGNLTKARVATVSLNPSNLEFVDKTGKELDEAYRRLETLKSLGISEWSEARSTHIRRIVRTNLEYFGNNPYDGWFRGLERLMSPAGVSYRGGAAYACHLDLIPFATVEKWTSLSPLQRARLLGFADNVVESLLLNSRIRILVLNGRTVIQHMERLTKVSFETEEVPEWTLPRNSGKGVSGIAYTGRIRELGGHRLQEEICVFGFNHNIQSSYGVTGDVKRSIRRWLSGHIEKVLQ